MRQIDEQNEESDRFSQEGSDRAKPTPKKPKRRPTRQTLEDVLKKQLNICPQITMYTQTDFSWKKMAMRWGHAKLMHASFVDPSSFYLEGIAEMSSKRLNMLCEQYPSLCCKLDLEQREILAPLLGRVHADAFAFGDIDVQLILDSLMKGAVPPQIVAFISDLAEQSSRILGSDKKEEEGGGKEARDAWSQARVLIRQRMEMLARISYCGPNEKCVDSSDLWFDPFDPNLNYTPKYQEEEPEGIIDGTQTLRE